ncbi:hypothetical protein [Pseudoalteromonas luteoviolacea]|uniref:hypothetical protein n=1 Tax=Pseudoalteromonas luteoviolacea TaxID=43657 RepID=UPI001B3894DB|nr:hypothetical protein [Pseudoalteromonas luteoviolacea]MBQ4835738.1 hypothetical protein [Pseudoalteromonas luteoviolacea]
MKWYLGVAFGALSFNSVSDTVNIEAKGNLEAFTPARCVEMTELSNKQSPADIFIGVAECLSNKEFGKASELLLAALAYGKYDTLRVKDKSAHQAISVLRMNSLSQLSELELKELQSTFAALMNNPIEKKKLCNKLEKLGSPQYIPKYMIQHGISAFTGKNKVLVDDFDAHAAWSEVKAEYAKCNL